MNIAQTIIGQLGGKQFISMTGAKDFVVYEKGVNFTIPFRKINKVQIELNGNDEYDMSFYSWRRSKVAEAKGVQAENLQEVFTDYTGLYCSLLEGIWI